MDGLRRTSDSTRQASDSLARLTLNKRGVQLVSGAAPAAAEASGEARTVVAKAAKPSAAAATKTAAAAAHGAAAVNAALSGERDSTEQASDRSRDVFAKASRSAAENVARGTATVVKGGAKVTGNAVKGGIVAAQKRATAAAAAKSTKAAADSAITVGRGAAAVARAGAAAAAAVKGIVAAVVAAASSTPVLAIVGAVVIAVVSILALISWLPGITTPEAQEGQQPTGVLVGTDGWVSPVREGTTLSSTYGPRPRLCTPGGCTNPYHYGIDLPQGCGVPIVAAADGRVRSAGPNGGWGNAVILDHNDDGAAVATLYAHMQWGSLKVAQGQEVKAGDVLGLEGTTGKSEGCHLHYEVYINGANVDPRAFMAARDIEYR